MTVVEQRIRLGVSWSGCWSVFLTPTSAPTDLQDVHGAAVRGPGYRGDEVRCRGGLLPDAAAPAPQPPADSAADPVSDRLGSNQSKLPTPAWNPLLPPRFLTAHCPGRHHHRCRENGRHGSSGCQRLCVSQREVLSRDLWDVNFNLGCDWLSRSRLHLRSTCNTWRSGAETDRSDCRRK